MFESQIRMQFEFLQHNLNESSVKYQHNLSESSVKYLLRPKYYHFLIRPNYYLFFNQTQLLFFKLALFTLGQIQNIEEWNVIILISQKKKNKNKNPANEIGSLIDK